MTLSVMRSMAMSTFRNRASLESQTKRIMEISKRSKTNVNPPIKFSVRNVLKSGIVDKTLKALVLRNGNLGGDEHDLFKNINKILAGSALLLTGAFLCPDWSNDTKCCGIMGVVGKKGSSGEDARDVLLEGLSILLNRGYDSAGMATSSSSRGLMISKFSSEGDKNNSFELLKDNSMGHKGNNVGIAHTRWATHGGKTDQNAHPHTDYYDRITLVHNGTINNAHELKKDLEENGTVFTSETDTEVISQMIGFQMKSNPNLSLRDALENTVSKLDGTWGLAVIDKENPEEIVLSCNGSPMVIGLGDDHVYVASETSAFNRYTKNFIAMKDGEFAVITPTSCSLDTSRVEIAPDHGIETSPGKYDHWTLYEALQQPDAIERALSFGGRMTDNGIVLGGLDAKKEVLRGIKNMTLTACGTSLFASQYGAKLMRDLGSVDTCYAMDAAELRIQDIPSKNGGIIAASQSGETRDTLKAIKQSEMLGIPRMSIVNMVGSALARETGLGVYLNAGRETAVASTKAFTTQVTVLSLISLWFRQLRDEEGHPHGMVGNSDPSKLIESLRRLPKSFETVLGVRDQCKEAAKKLLGKKSCFVLGKGYGEAVVGEASLKLKEMAYIHAEGMTSSAMKHGVYALVEDDSYPGGSTPVIMLILDDEHSHQIRTAGEQLKARGADLIVITDKASLADGISDNPIVIPSNGRLTALVGVFPLQMIAYELALLKGINPDQPRNLAKCVTTD